MRLVDADAEIERLKRDYCEPCAEKRKYGIFGAACTLCGIMRAVEEFEDATTVEPLKDAADAKHGVWEDQYHEVIRGKTGKHIVASARCSVCKKYASQVGNWTGRVQYKNCPSCLARMDEC